MARDYEAPDWEEILDAEDENLADAWVDSIPPDDSVREIDFTGMNSVDDIYADGDGEDMEKLRKEFAQRDAAIKEKYKMYYDQVMKVKTRHYLKCPKEEFDEAKAKGAYYDTDKDMMYYLGTQRAGQFEKWSVASVVKI